MPFPDTKQLESFCSIKMQSARTHEVSSFFRYDLIAEYGGMKVFINDFISTRHFL
jgi:hypothetical protein